MKKEFRSQTRTWQIGTIVLIFGLILSACNNGQLSASESNEATLAVAVIDLQNTLQVALSATPYSTSEQPATPTEAVAVTATSNPTYTPEVTATATETPEPTATTSSWYYVAPVIATATPTSGISLSSTSVARGESFTVSVYGFTAYTNVDLWLYEIDSDSKTIYDGVTDSTGAYSVTLVMPSTAESGEYWAVYVHTTDLESMETATSATITVSGDTSGATVSVSSTSLIGGENFTVTATGFPAYSNIDIKLTNEDGTSVVIVDGYTDSTGACATTMTMPSTAEDYEEWAVKVYTTDLATQIIAYSSTITSYAADATATPTVTTAPTATPTIEPTTVPTNTPTQTVEPTATEEVVIVPTSTPEPTD